MSRMSRALIAIALIGLFALPVLAQQQPDPNSPRYKGVMALVEFLGSDGQDAVTVFIETRVATSVRLAMGDTALAAALTAMRAEAGGAQMRGARPLGPLAAEVLFDTDDGMELAYSFELSSDDTDRFLTIESPGQAIR